MPVLISVQSSRYRATEEANARMTRFAEKTGWRDDQIARLAISRSLRESDALAPFDGGRDKGKELRGETLFATRSDPDYLPWAVAMIQEHEGRQLAVDEIVERVHAHWHRGLQLLLSDLADAHSDFADFLLGLARAAAETIDPMQEHGDTSVPSARAGAIRPLTVPIGRFSEGEVPFEVTLNDTRTHANCHMAISGISGSGKTQLAMQIGATAVSKADGTMGLIFIDYAKGDVASNDSFVRAVQATVIRMPGKPLPVGAFHLPEYSDQTRRLAAEEKREVYTNLFRTLGPKQEGRLAEAIRASYEQLEHDADPAPDFHYVQQVLDRIYQRDRLQPDSLTELFRRMTAYHLFWTRRDGIPPVSPIHQQRWIVDIHELGGLKEVAAFTLIEQLYREMRGLPDSDVDSESGLRHIRCMLFIDEAQYYLQRKNRFLQGIIREGRSKGFSVVLLCQSPDDFDQPDFDYTEQLEFTYMLAAKTDPKAVSRLLGVSRYQAKRIAEELGRMEPLYGVGRGKDGPSPRFRLVPFFETGI